MCGRFTQHLSWAEIRRLADLVGQPRNLAPRYNVAPTDLIEVIRAGPAGLELTPMRWGLVPCWWKKPLEQLPATFNARAETLGEKPMFRAAFKSRRCIVPASGFYEWTGEKGRKIPHYFSSADGLPLALAGLWEQWRDPNGQEVFSATIVVGAANGWMSRFHDRMPIFLSWSDAQRLDRRREPRGAASARARGRASGMDRIDARQSLRRGRRRSDADCRDPLPVPPPLTREKAA